MMKLTKSSRVFRRATAFILAAAMTLSAPVATQASAASKKKVPSLSVKKKTLYYNKAGKKSFTLKIKKNKVKKIVKTKWTTSKKSVVNISKQKKTTVKVTAKKKGSAKIKATVKYRVKASSKIKTKKLTCTVTSKKQGKNTVTPAPATETPVASGTPATDTPPADTKKPDETQKPADETKTPDESAKPSEEPGDAKAIASNVTAIEVDGSDFQFTLMLEENKNNEAAVKDAKLDLKNGSISATASFKEMDGANSAIFKIDDSKTLKPGDRSADGKYEVTTSSKSLTLPAGAYTTYEEAIDALAVEGFVTTPRIVNNAIDVNHYDPVADATITLIENGKTVKTDSRGYYKLTTSSGTKTLRVEKDGFIGQITPADHIIVNKSHLTSQNFVLATFNPDNIKVKVTVLDSENGKVIPGANVQILDDASKAVANVKTDVVTDATGVSTFANKGRTEVVIDGANSDRNQTYEPNFFEKDKTYKVKVSKGLNWAHLTQDRTGAHDNGIYEENTVEVKIETKHDYDVTVRLRPIKELPALKVTQKYDPDTFEYTKKPADTLTSAEMEAAEGVDPTVYEVYTKYELYADYDGNGIAEELANYSKDVARHDELEGIPEGIAKASAPVVNGQCTTKINKKGETNIDMLDPNGDGNNADNLLGLAAKPCLPSGTYYLILRSYTAGDYATPATTTDYTVAEIKVEEGKTCDVTVTRSKPVRVELQSSLDPDKAAGDVQNKAATGNALMSVVRKTPDNHSTDYMAHTERVYTQNTLYRKIGSTLIKVENSEVAYTYNPALTDADKPYSDLTLVYTEKDIFVANNEYTHLTEKEDYVVRARSNYAVADDLAVRVKDNLGDTIKLKPRFRFNQIKIKKQADDALLDGADIRRIEKIRVLNSAGKEICAKNINWWEDISKSDTAAPVADNDFAVFNNAALQKALFETDLDNKVKIEVTLRGCNPVTSGEINITDLEYVNVEITEKVTPVTGLTKLSGTVTVNRKDGTVDKAFTNDGIGDASNNLVQVILYNSANKIVAFGKTSDPKNGISSYSVVQGTGSNKELKAGDYKLVARGYRTETYVANVTLKDQQTTTLDLVLDEGGQGSAKAVMTDTNLNPISGGIDVVAYDSNHVYAQNWAEWASSTTPAFSNGVTCAANEMDINLYGRYAGANVLTQDNNSGIHTDVSLTEKQLSNLSVGSYTIHFYENGTEFSNVGDLYTHENQTLVLSTNGESKRPEYRFLPINAAPGGKVRLTVRQTAGLVNRVVLAKPLDADGKEISDQIEDIVYVGRATATYPDKVTASIPGMNAGQTNFTVLKVDPHRAYNVYVYDFTDHYVVKQMKNVEGVDAEITIDYTQSAHD